MIEVTEKNLVDDLKSLAFVFEDGYETDYDVNGLCELAAEKLEQLHDENKQLHESKPVRCGECMYYEVSTQVEVNSHCKLPSGGIHGHDLKSWEFCSGGKRGDRYELQR